MANEGTVIPDAGPGGWVGLTANRITLGPTSAVTLARDHLVVRTPSRPDFLAGNMLQLLGTPTSEEIGGWLETFRRTIGALPGVEHVWLQWETEHGAPPFADDTARHPTGDDWRLESATVMALDHLVAPDRHAPLEIVPVADPRHWHGATVLYRHAGWGGDDDFWRWRTEVLKAQVVAGRGALWLGFHQGIPVTRAAVVHDNGLAVVDDVVTHPAHRGLGLAGAVCHRAVADHRDRHPEDLVVVLTQPDGPGRRLYDRLGFSPISTVWTVMA